MGEKELATSRCPSCGDPRAKIQNWLPDEGLEPRLREFKCRCGFVFYSRLALTSKAITGLPGRKRKHTAILGR